MESVHKSEKIGLSTSRTFQPFQRFFRIGILLLLQSLIRGLSAAIVVFLAAEEGLAIFSSTGSADSNPYVLLFTCLIGAVFSQDVWQRVQTWLKNSGGASQTPGPQDQQ